MEEPKIVNDFLESKRRSEEVGLTLQVDNAQFKFADVPGSSGLVCFETLEELDTFIYWYQFGYKSGL